MGVELAKHLGAWMAGALLLLRFAPAARAAPAGLGTAVLPAAGFEDGLGPWVPTYGRQAIDMQVAHSGKASLRLDDAGAVMTDFLEIGDACWKLSFGMKTKDVVLGPQPWSRAGLQVSYYDADRKNLGHQDVGLTLGTTDWTRHQDTHFFDPKEGIRFIRLSLMNWDCAGTTWFDDVELVTAPIPEAYLKVPPLPQVENQPPRTWRLPPVTPLAALKPHVRWRVAGSDLPVHVQGLALAGELIPGRPRKVQEGFDIHRGYMTRKVRRIGPGAGPDGWLAEVYEEQFRGSPIHSWFPRVWLPNGRAVGPLSYQVRLAGEVARVRWFAGNRLAEGTPGTPILLGPETTKPFVVLSNAADDAGVILFHPIPAEVRRWHVEDYLIERELPVRLSLARSAEGARLTYAFGGVETGAGGYCHSLDFYVFAMPYRGRFQDALKQLQLGATDLLADALPFSAAEPRGYWQPFMGEGAGARLSRMARYFPREFASWMSSSTWDYGHKGGHGWGCTTATMKGIRVDPLAENALARDYAWRMLTFFLEASGETGAPPHMYTWRGHAADFQDVREHYTVVFCQYWEWRLEEFRKWLAGSALLTAPEKERVYQDLQRARKLFDPSFRKTTWTYPTPNGGYWFEYFDKPRGRRAWVINTHTTSLGNVGDFALLARDLGKDADLRYWRRIFERGVDGLIWAWEQPDMWADYDPNEVLYARPPGGGPRGYHQYMVTAWTHKVVRQAMELGDYRLADLVRYWKRMASAAYTTDSDRALTAPVLKQAEERLKATTGR